MLVVPYFAADFRIGQTRFCNAGLDRNGASFFPAIGDKVLVFAFQPPRGNYLSVRDENLIFGRNDDVYGPLAFDSYGPGLPRASFARLVTSLK